MGNINLTWLGHACFIIEKDGYKILIDPYKADYVDGLHLNKQKVNAVVCSHEHTDHADRSIALIAEDTKAPFEITVINTYHDRENGKLRGQNKIRIFEADGIKIVHMGDLGCDVKADEAELMKNADVLLIPTGGTYTIDSAEANNIANRLMPKAVIPMHYRTDEYGFPVLLHIHEFTKLRKDVTYSDSNSVCITKDSPRGTLVLKYEE